MASKVLKDVGIWIDGRDYSGVTNEVSGAREHHVPAGGRIPDHGDRRVEDVCPVHGRLL